MPRKGFLSDLTNLLLTFSGLSLNGRRQRTCIAKTMVELCRLSKENLLTVLKIDHFRKPFRAMLSKHLSNLEAALVKGKTLDPTMLYCVDWKSIRQQLQNEDKKWQLLGGATVPAEMSESVRHILDRHKDGHLRFLTTEIQLIFKHLGLLHGRKLKSDETVVIAASWPGYSNPQDYECAGLPSRTFSVRHAVL